MEYNTKHGVSRHNTDFGFVLEVPSIDGWDFEAYGQSGIGRYELFCSCAYDNGTSLDEALADMDETEIAVYRKTKAALDTYGG